MGRNVIMNVKDIVIFENGILKVFRKYGDIFSTRVKSINDVLAVLKYTTFKEISNPNSHYKIVNKLGKAVVGDNLNYLIFDINKIVDYKLNTDSIDFIIDFGDNYIKDNQNIRINTGKYNVIKMNNIAYIEYKKGEHDERVETA